MDDDEVERGQRLATMWGEVERAIVSLTLDGADPGDVLTALEGSLSRCFGVAWPREGDLPPSIEVIDPATRARIGRAFDLAREARRNTVDPELRELRHDVSSALTAVVASLEVASESIDDGSEEARAELITAVSYAREAATRAIHGFHRIAR